MPSTRPHLVIFNPDSWRGDVLGHVGDRAAVTPVLDGIVRTEGVSFEYAFCQNPVCTPSRASFMTGWYPHVRGHRTMFHMLRRDEPCLLRTLRQNGYFVWWGGKNDLVPAQHGFEEFCDVKHRPQKPPAPDPHESRDWRGAPEGDNYYSFYRGKLLPTGPDGRRMDFDWSHVDGAIDFIRNRPKDRPLCIYLPLGYPHPPYAAEQEWIDRIDPRALPPRTPAPKDWGTKPSILAGIARHQHLQGWSEQRWAALRCVYYAMCARVDYQLGCVIEALRQAGIYRDTALFAFSDHGDFTGDYGLVEKTQNTFEDCLTRVPFVIKPPVGVPVKPRVSRALVELVDFPATVEALTGIAPGHTHFGRSLLPLIAGATDEHRDAVFCEGGRVHGERHCMELDSTSSNDPAGLYWPRVNLQQSEGPEHTKAVMCRTREFKYVRRLYESDELYDLRVDPRETDNRIADSALAAPLARLKERMLTFFLETGDVVPHDTDKR